MTTNLALEGTIDKILKNTENDVLSSLKSALDDSQQNLDDSITKLESEYDKIVSDGKKEADKIEKQGFDHYMLKEIYEQPKAIKDTLRGRLNVSKGIIKLSGLDDYINKFISNRIRPNFKF